MKRNGFTLIEMLIGLTFSSLVMMLIYSSLHLMLKSKSSINFVDQNQIGLIQLQHELNFAHSLHLSDNDLCYTRLEEEFCLSQHNDKLVKQPGYEIFLTDINSIEFIVTDNLIILLDGQPYEIEI